MNEPASLTSQAPDGGATQVSILLSSATATIDEEFRRSERIDAKSRNQVALAATFFAIVQAGVISLINGTLSATSTHPASSFILWLALTAIAAAMALAATVAVSYRAWRLYDDPTLRIKTIRDYLRSARDGNPAVGPKLVEAYAKIAEGRRDNNKLRTDALERATKACGVTLTLLTVELVLAFVAVAVQ